MKIDLAYSISQLLYRYDCVIIPGFGGFVTQFKSAAIDRQAHSIYPPSKEVSFNSMLVKNDGVLVTGNTVLDAFDRLEVLEATAEAVINSKAIGDVSSMSPETITELRKAFNIR